jgi:hypothetical protein
VIQGTWIFDVDLYATTLKSGLARLLDAYPPLCGRIAGDHIEWAAGGVPFVEVTDTTIMVHDFGPAAVDATRFGYRCSPTRIRLGLAPLLTVTLTHIRDGCVLAICTSHACVDGNGFYTMVQNLARAATGRPFPPTVFDRPPAPPVRRRDEVKRSAREAGYSRSRSWTASATRSRALVCTIGRWSPTFVRCAASWQGSDGTELRLQAAEHQFGPPRSHRPPHRRVDRAAGSFELRAVDRDRPARPGGEPA